MNEETLFREALALSPEERIAFLSKACEGRPELRASVESLLAAHEQSGLILDRPPINLATIDLSANPAPVVPIDHQFAPTGEHIPTPVAAPSSTTRTADFQAISQPGAVIAGRYTLQEEIGEGGMGVVWVAKQTEPVKRKVALKLIKTGMDSRAVLQRFEQERQALAMMDHPNIAKVLDGGLTPTGQPFFVMELVNGLPLSRFCDELKLTTTDRLELFVPICQAVQHAHQKGIVHRDLKPANILITMIDGKPVPKVIDFGVAKATAGKLTDESMSTQFGAIVGTLEYMSPEQAGFSGTDIDTRADIYSLGVILYELLTGLRPIDAKRLKKAALTEMIRIIQEEEPSKPSTRLSTDDSLPSMAALRQIEPRRLMALLRGELDWVVMKCLEKHRERRYDTANALARDIQRYLADEAVEARPPSAGYRFGKFVKRNRGAVLAASIVLFTALLGTSAVLAVQALSNTRLTKANNALNIANGETNAALEQTQKAQKATTLALVETQKAQKETVAALGQSEESRKQAVSVGDFLVDAFAKPDPFTEGKDVKVADILDQALAGLDKGFAGSKATQGAMLSALGRSYQGLGLYSKAEEAHRKARAAREVALGPSSREALTSAACLAQSIWDGGRRSEGQALLEEVLGRQKSAFGFDDSDTLETRHTLYSCYSKSGRAEEAIPLLQAALAACELKPDLHPDVTLATRDALGTSYMQARRTAEAISIYETNLKLRESKLALDHPHTMQSRNNLASAYQDAGRTAEATRIYETNLQLVESKVGPDHPNTLISRNNLADSYLHAGRVDKAIPILESNLRLQESKFAPDHPNTMQSRNNLALAYLDAGRVAEAIPIFETNLKLRESKLGPYDPATLTSRNNLALAYQAAGRIADAIPILESMLKVRESKLSPDHPDTLLNRNNLALAYQAVGRVAEAIPIFESTLKLRESKLGPDHPHTVNSRNNLGFAYQGAGRAADAIPIFESTLKLRESKLGPDHPDTFISRNNLAYSYQSLDRWADAEPLYRDNLVSRRKKEKPDSPLLAGELASLGRNLLKQSRSSEAEPLLRECLAIRVKAIPDDYRRYNAASLLGGALLGQGKFAEAEPLILAGYEGMKAREAKIAPIFKFSLIEAGERVVQLYHAWGKSEKAAEWAIRLGLPELPADVFAR